MTIKRDARGTLRDYARELEGELLSIFLSLFKSFEIFSVTFPAASLFKPDSNSPWRSFSPFDITNSTHPAFAISTTEERRIMSITLWGNKTKVLFTVVKPVSVYVVYECPTVFRLTDNMVMDEITAESSVAIVAFVEFDSKKLFVVNIFIKNSVANKFVFDIIQWGFYYIPIDNSVLEYSILGDWGNMVFISSFGSPVMELAESFCKMRTITPWNFAYHNNIISKNYKVSRRNNG